MARNKTRARLRNSTKALLYLRDELPDKCVTHRAIVCRVGEDRMAERNVRIQDHAQHLQWCLSLLPLPSRRRVDPAEGGGMAAAEARHDVKRGKFRLHVCPV